MRSVRDAIDRLRNESNGQMVVSTTPQQEREETPRHLDPALFYAVSARNWGEAEGLVDVGVGLEYKKVSKDTCLLLWVRSLEDFHKF
jgi:hypothetical protein